MSKKSFNPRQLRPADLLRIVNAVDLPNADSLTEFQLRRHKWLRQSNSEKIWRTTWDRGW